MTCIFFGHKDPYGLDIKGLMCSIEKLIKTGVTTFYVGNQGGFDRIVYSCLKDLKGTHPEISYAVVLAYLPTHPSETNIYQDCSILPEGQEYVHPKFAIEKRNRWMIGQADYCICYINNTWGGAYKFAREAKRRGIITINLGNVDF